MSDNSGVTDATLSIVVSGSTEELTELAMSVLERIGQGHMRGTVAYKPDYSSLSIDELLGYDPEVDSAAVRPRNTLRRAGICTVGGLEGKTADDLLAFTNFGQKSLDFLNARLRQEGLPEIGDKPYAL